MDLHPHEIKVLKALKKECSPGDVAEETGLQVDAVLRASSWLVTKKLVEQVEEVSEDVSLDDEGRDYAKKGLPERQLIKLIGSGISMDELKKKADKNIFSIGFGWLKRKKQVGIKDGKVKVINSDKTSDEILIEKLGKGSVNTKQLSEREDEGLKLLKSRQNVVAAKEVKAITLKATKDGLTLAGKVKDDDSISQLTPKMLADGSWKGRKFRPYDTSVFVKPENPVRKHPLRRQINKIRRIFVGMGFDEISGPLIESAFWNFDALFQPQDHPARDMHDTFYLKNPKEVEIEDFDKLKGDVGRTHEDGWTTGSTGWGYKWSDEVARKTLLRTHTTCVTARYLSSITEEDLPAKVFCIGKVFRNEAVDYKHLPEFYQVEGIVVDPSVNFRNLLGILKEFYNEMGFDKVRFRPGYFPYTEMSCEPEVYFEEKKEWVELGGSGIFRPEVVKPLLGVDVPVLAWGLGLDRVVAMSLGLKDIRELYMSDLDWLRSH